MKYIRAKRLENTRDVVVVFPRSIQHLFMARQLGICTQIGVISAGFVRYDVDGKPECYGESIGLRRKSRGVEDTQRLNDYINIDDAQ